MSKSQGEDEDLTFWFWYAVVAGIAFGLWQGSYGAGLFSAMIAFPLLACVSKVHSWATASERTR